jgi:hypothetical protein
VLALTFSSHCRFLIIHFIASKFNDVQLNTTSLVFERLIRKRCVIVTVADSDTRTGNRSYNLILERSNEMSTALIVYYPNTVSILVIDDGISGKNMAADSNRFRSYIMLL